MKKQSSDAAPLLHPQKQYELLLGEHKELVDSKNDQLDMIKQFRQRTEKITQSLKEDERIYREQTADGKVCVLSDV